MALVWIPAGSFDMGSSRRPAPGRVSLRGFYIGRHPVTYAELTQEEIRLVRNAPGAIRSANYGVVQLAIHF